MPMADATDKVHPRCDLAHWEGSYLTYLSRPAPWRWYVFVFFGHFHLVLHAIFVATATRGGVATDQGGPQRTPRSP
eukprot:362747-Pleurochrysis_carterae.AAC.1